jgi:hypothetical protein
VWAFSIFPEQSTADVCLVALANTFEQNENFLD